MTDEPRNPDRDSEQEINKRPDERTDQGERLTERARPTDEEVPAPATGGKGAAGAGGPDGFGTGSE